MTGHGLKSLMPYLAVPADLADTDEKAWLLFAAGTANTWSTNNFAIFV